MSTFLEEKEVNLVALSLELEQAAIEHTVQDDKRIYVTESGMFPFWLRLYPDPHMLSFSTYLEFDAALAETERHAFCNRLNSKSLLPAIHAHNDRLYADYAMSYRDGLIRSQFIRICRTFANGVEHVKQELGAVSDGAQ